MDIIWIHGLRATCGHTPHIQIIAMGFVLWTLTRLEAGHSHSWPLGPKVSKGKNQDHLYLLNPRGLGDQAGGSHAYKTAAAIWEPKWSCRRPAEKNAWTLWDQMYLLIVFYTPGVASSLLKTYHWHAKQTLLVPKVLGWQELSILPNRWWQLIMFLAFWHKRVTVTLYFSKFDILFNRIFLCQFF